MFVKEGRLRMIIEELRIPTVEPDQLPAGHVALTFPMRHEDVDTIASIWLTSDAQLKPREE
jgi:hypothetical protein